MGKGKNSVPHESENCYKIFNNAYSIGLSVTPIEIFDYVTWKVTALKTKYDLTVFNEITILNLTIQARFKLKTIITSASWAGIFSTVVPLTKPTIQAAWSD